MGAGRSMVKANSESGEERGLVLASHAFGLVNRDIDLRRADLSPHIVVMILLSKAFELSRAMQTTSTSQDTLE